MNYREKRLYDEIKWANRVAMEDTIGKDLTDEEIAKSGHAVSDRWSEKVASNRHKPKSEWPKVTFALPELLKVRLDLVADAVGVPASRILVSMLERHLGSQYVLEQTIDREKEAEVISARAWAAGALARWREKMRKAREQTGAMEKYLFDADIQTNEDWSAQRQRFMYALARAEK